MELKKESQLNLVIFKTLINLKEEAFSCKRQRKKIPFLINSKEDLITQPVYMKNILLFLEVKENLKAEVDQDSA